MLRALERRVKADPSDTRAAEVLRVARARVDQPGTPAFDALRIVFDPVRLFQSFSTFVSAPATNPLLRDKTHENVRRRPPRRI